MTTTAYLTAFLASLAAGLSLPLRLETTVSVFVVAGFLLIAVQDYARAPRTLSLSRRPRTLRPRAHFRPLPLSLPTQPQGIEIRPIIQRLREHHRLAA